MFMCKKYMVASAISFREDELFCKEAFAQRCTFWIPILGIQSNLNVCVNNIVLHVKAYIWRCKLQSWVPSYNKLRVYIGSRKMLELNLECFYDSMQ